MSVVARPAPGGHFELEVGVGQVFEMVVEHDAALWINPSMRPQVFIAVSTICCGPSSDDTLARWLRLHLRRRRSRRRQHGPAWDPNRHRGAAFALACALIARLIQAS